MAPGRLGIGLLTAVLAVLLAYVGGWLLAAAVALLSLTALLELRWVANRCRLRLSLEVAYAICVAYVFAAHWFADDLENFGIALLALTVLMLLVDFALHLHHGLATPTANVSLTAFACLWCGLLFASLVLVRGYQPDLTASTPLGPDWPLGRRLLLYLLGVTFAGELAAGLGDTHAGRRRLDQTVHPHRTWEGIGAALLAAVLASLLFAWLFRVEAMPSATSTPEQVRWLTLKHSLVLGLLLGAVGQLGDFGASIFRHEAGVRHFGALPGSRAGVLDRLAALIAGAPLLYLYANLAL